MFELLKKEYRLMRIPFLVMLVLMVVNFINLFLGLDYFGSGFIMSLTSFLVITSFYIFGAFSLFRDNLKLLLTNPRSMFVQLGLKVVLAGFGALIVFSLYVLSMIPTDLGQQLIYLSFPVLRDIFLSLSASVIAQQVASFLLPFNFGVNIAFICMLVWSVFKTLKRYVGFHAWWISAIIFYLLTIGVYQLAYKFSIFLSNMSFYSVFSLGHQILWIGHAGFLIYSALLFTITCYLTERKLEV